MSALRNLAKLDASSGEKIFIFQDWCFELSHFARFKCFEVDWIIFEVCFSSYIFEEKAMDILNNSPQLKREFEAKKKSDKSFLQLHVTTFTEQ